MHDGPLDDYDPRFPPSEGEVTRPRELVASRGPGASPGDRKVAILRIAIPALALAGLLTVGAVFFQALRAAPADQVIGDEADIRAAVEDRPRRVCLDGDNPCAWLTVVEDRLVAFNTNGPLPQEYGRLGVAWCPSSRWFGANATGSRWDLHGRLARGPSPRDLDRFTLLVDADGIVTIDFASLTAGRTGPDTDDATAADGPDCDPIPFDRDPDLDLAGG